MNTSSMEDIDMTSPQPKEPTWESYRSFLQTRWEEFLGSCKSEREMQEFLERHPCLLPGATNDIAEGSHHGATFSAVIRQPSLEGLGPKRLPDFMWVRRGSGVIYPICVEIEDPKKVWFNKGTREMPGVPSADLTQAMDQLVEWKIWFSKEENQSIFKKIYAPAHTHWRIEPRYVLVYGRDSEFRQGTSTHKGPDHMRHKRDLMRRDKEHFLTFDRLAPKPEGGKYATITRRGDGWELHAVPPTFSLDPYCEDLCEIIGEPGDAISRAEIMTPEWKGYLIAKWKEMREEVLSRQNAVFLPRGH
ncbi:Shedu anti-phage system protein SduA domain-containing protein [Streptomyces chartreusis]|uniref:Shedu anti-phage system protein SduA domain-containing protein n=1 Tax=Streptomyces chartreusis TaxID=1969 RepID=UPI002E7FE23C|nr:Shedu anti-phage system protein SduA domain-containing protein [Streptomyces chartreusis]WUB19513.1 DUF4263 domain-containing protein [Streptomyces chartreusis]